MSTESSPALICTIEPEWAELIGATMQWLSLRECEPPVHHCLRIMDGDRRENRAVVTRARTAGLSPVVTPRREGNPFLNKWSSLSELLRVDDSPAGVIDWDVLNTGGVRRFPTDPSNVLARRNPTDLYLELAVVAESIVASCWQDGHVVSSINSGLVLAPSRLLLRMAERTIDIGCKIKDRSPGAPAWQIEQLAASLAAGQLGLAPLESEWNVTPLSPVGDEATRLWHYNNGLDLTRTLKRVLDQPERVRQLLEELSGRWPRQAERMARLHARALDLLDWTSRTPAPGSSRRKARASGGAEPRNWPPPSKRSLLGSCSSGLANRMLMIAGCLRVAARTGRDFLLHWPVNSELGCTFHHLFTNPFRLFSDPDLHYLLATDVTVKIYNAWRMEEALYSDMSADGDPDAEIVLVKAWHYPKFRHEAYDGEMYESVRPRLASLLPRSELLEEVFGFALPVECLGVHVRRGDPAAEFARSRDQDFQRIMEAVVSEYPDVCFFLATDDPVTEKKFRRMFGDRVLCFEKRGGGRAEERGMEEALIDLWLLSRTRAIVGNHYSSFTHAAGALGGRRIVIAEPASATTRLHETLRVISGAIEGPGSEANPAP